MTPTPPMVDDVHRHETPSTRAWKQQQSSLKLSLEPAERQREMKSSRWPAQCSTAYDTEDSTAEGSGGQWEAVSVNKQRSLPPIS